jgi:hypothetical protein
MNLSINGTLSMQDQTEGQGSVVMGIVGAAAGAIAMGIVYGLVSRLIWEQSYVAVLVGVAAGFGALKLGRGRSLPVGIAAAALTLVGSLVGKLIIGSPEGVSWFAYHTTLFDILFCYLAAPATALAIAGTDKLRELRRFLPV